MMQKTPCIKGLKTKKLKVVQQTILMAGIHLKEGELENAIVKYYLATTLLEEEKTGMILPISPSLKATFTCFSMNINSGLGRSYEKKGKYNKAIEFLDTALQLYFSLKKPFGVILNGAAEMYWLLGKCYYKKGYLKRAMSYFEELYNWLHIKEDESNFAHDEFYYYMGLCHAKLGDYEQGIPFLNRALSIREEKKEEVGIAKTYMALAFCYKEDKISKKMVTYLKDARSIFLKQKEVNNAEILKSHIYLGDYFLERNRKNKALKHYNKGLAREIGGGRKEGRLKMVLHTSKGKCLIKQKKYKEAEKELQTALRLAKRVLEPYSTELAMLYSDLGNCYILQNQYAKALQCCQKALIKLLPAYANENVYHNPSIKNEHLETYLLEILGTKVRAFYGLYEKNKIRKDLEVANTTFDLVNRLIHTIRQDYQVENSKLFLATRTHEIYDAALGIAYELWELTEEKEYLNKCFELAELGQSYILLTDIINNDTKKRDGIFKELSEGKVDLRLQLTHLNKLINKERAKGVIKNKKKMNEYEKEYNTIHDKHRGLIEQFKEKYPNYYRLKYGVNITDVEAIQGGLEEGTAMIEYFVGNEWLYIYFITNTEYKIIKVKRPEKFKKLIRAFQTTVKKDKITEKYRFIKSAYELYSALFPEGLRKLMEERGQNGEKRIKRLIIIPDEELATIPFEALLTKRMEEKDPYSILPYLIRDYLISYHYSATLWSYGCEKRNGSLSINVKGFVGFAPVYKTTKDIAKEKKTSVFKTKKKIAKTVKIRRHDYVMLLASKSEVINIASAFEKEETKPPVKSYLEGEATENNFKKYASEYKYILISAHGEYQIADPQSIRIVFSPNENSNEKYSFLTMAEAYNLELNADLVVLSCCETGLGRVVKGEGVMAMNRGFLFAGAANVIYTLFKIHDKHSAELTQIFFNFVIDEISYVEALRKAKLELITNDEYAPVHWAGFVLIGD